MLEQRMKQRQEYKQAYFRIKSDDIQSELAQIEVQKVKASARNQALLRNIEEALRENDDSAS